ncbi:MAG TPA: hypothetical protein VK427_16830 [Kofleriaceae bacterium]|nr:hypothetical protein [Kofleriaceae bacterium]
MRFKNVLGLLAIGGAVVYAQKKRGGEMSLNGFKESFRGIVDNVRGQIDNLRNAQGGQRQAVGSRSTSSAVGGDIASSDMGTQRSGVADDYSGTSGYSSGSLSGSNGIDRKF